MNEVIPTSQLPIKGQLNTKEKISIIIHACITIIAILITVLPQLLGIFHISTVETVTIIGALETAGTVIKKISEGIDTTQN